MRKRLLIGCSVLLAVAGYDCRVREGTLATNGREVPPSEVPEPYVQITSVVVEPTAIHTTREPKSATVVVQMILRGDAPRKAEARVDIGTYSSDPPGIDVRYSQPQTVPVKSGVTVMRFTVQAGPKTSQGKLKIAATIYGPGTKGVNVKQPELPKDGLAELTTFDP